MSNDIPCVCGHSKSNHNMEYPDNPYCQANKGKDARNNDYWVDDCQYYRADNLLYLEQKALDK
jgi:hypothetical protein